MPVSKSRRSGQFHIENNKEIRFAGGRTLEAGVWFVLADIYAFPPRSELLVDKIQADLGLQDDPTDEAVNFALCFAPVDLTSRPATIFWETVQRWRAMGTPSAVLDVQERFDESFEDRFKAGASNKPFGQGQPLGGEIHLILIAFSNTTSIVAGTGVVSITERLLIRIFSDGDHGWGDTEVEEIVITMWGDEGVG